jgi:hypothetical protein
MSGWGNQSKSKSGPGSNVMGLGHEKRDGYRLSIGSVAWVYEKADGLTGNHRSARDQWLRASQSIPLNTEPNRRKSIPVPISISKRRSPNKAVEATEYRRFTADVRKLQRIGFTRGHHGAGGQHPKPGSAPPAAARPGIPALN